MSAQQIKTLEESIQVMRSHLVVLPDRSEEIESTIRYLTERKRKLELILQLQAQVKELEIRVESFSMPPEAMCVVDLVYGSYGLTRADFRKRSRVEPILSARHITIWLIRNSTHYSLELLGKFFGGMRPFDHGTILNAVERVKARIETDRRFAVRVADLEARAQAIFAQFPATHCKQQQKPNTPNADKES